jgi:hypothetical protein
MTNDLFLVVFGCPNVYQIRVLRAHLAVHRLLPLVHPRWCGSAGVRTGCLAGCGELARSLRSSRIPSASSGSARWTGRLLSRRRAGVRPQIA